MAIDANDESFMRAALEQARLAAAMGEVPVGAVVVCGGKIIAAAHNRRESDEDPSAHAEFSAMVEASEKLGRWRLYGCTVYVTLEPCLMCAGLMVNARIDRCVYGAADPRGGACGSLYRLQDDTRLNHAFEVTPGILRDECAQILRDFFAQARKENRADQRPSCCAHAPAACAGPARAAGPRVLLAVDSFKGSATSEQIEAWTSAGIAHACPHAQLTCVPIADGGEGTMDAVHASCGGELREITVSGPLGKPLAAHYLMLPAAADADGSSMEPAAVVELAQAAGIGQSDRALSDALAASTFGVGQLIRAAVDAGATTVYIGLGGSATTDGGAGMLEALGARLLDAAGAPIAHGLAGLADLASIDLAPALDGLRGVHLVVLGDVDNPLVGTRGAVRVFGPQKGLVSSDDVPYACDLALFDGWMVSYARLLTEARDALDGTSLQVGASGARPRSLAGVPGAGAAGGTAAALIALGARLSSGIETVLDLARFDAQVAQADLVITGEGNMDNQTASGKAPVGVARRAKRAEVPVAAVVGGRADDLDAVYKAGIDLVVPLCPRPQSLAQAMDPVEVERNARVAGETIMKAYLM